MAIALARRRSPPPTEAVTTKIISLARAGRHRDALEHYISHPHHLYNALPVLLKSCAVLSLPALVSQFHALAFKSSSLSYTHVLTSLLSAYSRLRLPSLASSLFSISSVSVPACYNALISGLSLNDLSLQAFSVFRLMLRSSVPFSATTMLSLLPTLRPSTGGLVVHAICVKSGFSCCSSVANALVSVYSRGGDMENARTVFDTMPEESRDLISWNSMLSAYAQNGMATYVLELYHKMTQRVDVVPDAVTLVSVLSSCASTGASNVGREVDDRVYADPSLLCNIFLGNGLINMHARCGNLNRAWQVFCAMPERTVVTWTAIISGYGMHGHGKAAVDLFESMLDAGIQPDGIAMLSVLSACSHAGLTDIGMQYFSGMKARQGLAPEVEHYACMVDLLGRAGRLRDALKLIQSMPMKPDGAVWGSLLGACKIHRDVKTAELAFENVVQLEPTNVGYYVLLSNIYTDAGEMEGIARVRRLMRQRGLKKEPGCSYIEHNKKIHLFLADDQSHPQKNDIYQIVAKLEAMAKEKDSSIKSTINGGVHSEKLAIAFGMLTTEAGNKIVVFKNLRVCDDCHQFLKFVSRIVNREMVVRDASRFHHFKDGVCSCNNYW